MQGPDVHMVESLRMKPVHGPMPLSKRGPVLPTQGSVLCLHPLGVEAPGCFLSCPQ